MSPANVDLTATGSTIIEAGALKANEKGARPEMKDFECLWQEILEECSKVQFPLEDEVELSPKEEIIMVLVAVDDPLKEKG